MNSKQRRTSRRYWKYSLWTSDDDAYEWAKQTYGKATRGFLWTHVDCDWADVFYFANEREYLMFVLRFDT
jgi:hypothetical protein